MGILAECGVSWVRMGKYAKICYNKIAMLGKVLRGGTQAIGNFYISQCLKAELVSSSSNRTGETEMKKVRIQGFSDLKWLLQI